MTTKTNNGALIELPVLHPRLKVGDIVSWMAATSRTLHTINFARKTGKIKHFNEARTRVYVEAKRASLWINLKDLT